MEPNIETRAINISHPDPYNPMTYDDFEPFGWVQTDAAVMGVSEYAILSRDRNMPHYYRIASLDEEYFSLKSMIKYPNKMNIGFLLLLLLCFLAPGILYFIIWLSRRMNINKYNKEILMKMDDIASEAYSLLEEPISNNKEDKKEETKEDNDQQCQK